MGHIFISYSHKDKKYVEKLEKKLIDEGFDVWIDHRIDYGSQWPKEIQRALDECDSFVVVVSENAYKSEWVQNEVARAKRKGKPFFPLLLQGDAWLVIESIQYVDVTGGSLPPEKFYKRLSEVVSKEIVETQLDKSKKLLMSTIQTWVDYGIFPSIQTLYIIWNTVKAECLSGDEIAFLYCAYSVNIQDTDEWLLDNVIFSFDSWLSELPNYQNSTAPIINLDEYLLDSFYKFTFGPPMEGGYDVLSAVVSVDDESQPQSVYCYVIDDLFRTLEILIDRSNGYKVLIAQDNVSKEEHISFIDASLKALQRRMKEIQSD